MHVVNRTALRQKMKYNTSAHNIKEFNGKVKMLLMINISFLGIKPILVTGCAHLAFVTWPSIISCGSCDRADRSSRATTSLAQDVGVNSASTVPRS